MDVETLANKFSKKINLEDVKKLTALTLNREISINDLFSLCLYQHQQIAFRASWVLENVADSTVNVFEEVVPQFLNAYPQIKNLSVKRHFTKIMMMLYKTNRLNEQNFNADLLEKSLTATFDWLLDPKTPLAVQCNALDLVFDFSKKENWVLEELKVILEKKLVTNSPALKSRSKRLLKRINSK
ncbi:hypothetical protein [Pedobacter alpinus]|uniref:Adenylosuccinate lyase n=1 Tax=Pedobacter alpinus TaxID=1590643 RepID=A0ABW5TQF0_9SPHI